MAAPAAYRIVYKVWGTVGQATRMAGGTVDRVNPQPMGRPAGFTVFDILVTCGAGTFLGGIVARDTVSIHRSPEAGPVAGRLGFFVALDTRIFFMANRTVVLIDDRT